jgi:hypothetical protein
MTEDMPASIYAKNNTMDRYIFDLHYIDAYRGRWMRDDKCKKYYLFCGNII